MNLLIKGLCFMILYNLCSFLLFCQETTSPTGGNATGSGGSVSYTIGQVAFNHFSGTNGFIIQGVQQPFEISILKEPSENTPFEINVYPNPTTGLIILIIKPFNNEDLGYQLLDYKGITLYDKKVENGRTEIQLAQLPPAMYFLRIIFYDEIVRVFKIVKI